MDELTQALKAFINISKSLKKQPQPQQTEEEERAKWWYKTRFDDEEYERRKQNILTNGQPTRLQFKAWPDAYGDPNEAFYVLEVTPHEGFTHLLNETGLKEQEAPYHISLGKRSVFQQRMRQDPQLLKDLLALRTYYEQPQDYRFYPTHLTSGGTLPIEEHEHIYPYIHRVWSKGSEGWKSAPHISL